MLWAMFVWSTVRINALFICLVNVARKPQISRCRNETSAFFRDLTAEWIGLGFTCHCHFQEGQWHGSHIVIPAQSHAPLLPFARQLLFQTAQPIFTLISKHMLFKYISISSTRAVCSSLRRTQRKPTAFAQGFEDTHYPGPAKCGGPHWMNECLPLRRSVAPTIPRERISTLADWLTSRQPIRA